MFALTKHTGEVREFKDVRGGAGKCKMADSSYYICVSTYKNKNKSSF